VTRGAAPIVGAFALLLLGLGMLVFRRRDEPTYAAAPQLEPTWGDEVDAAAAAARDAVMPAPVAGMLPSRALVDMLKLSEAKGGQPALTPYRLGDGGWTLGFGRYYKDGGPLPPALITREQAEQWLSMDIEQRGARWVRAYIKVPLTQAQFDALVHMAYNLSPGAFQTIAEAVNRGEDPEATALQYVRAGTNLEAGLRARRGHELALFRQGVYRMT
jgi:lysozyme